MGQSRRARASETCLGGHRPLRHVWEASTPLFTVWEASTPLSLSGRPEHLFYQSRRQKHLLLAVREAETPPLAVRKTETPLLAVREAEFSLFQSERLNSCLSSQRGRIQPFPVTKSSNILRNVPNSVDLLEFGTFLYYSEIR